METLGWLLLVPFFCYSATATSLQNQLCQAYPALIPIDHPQYNHYPYFVKLHRCGGACGTTPPTVENCVALKTKNITIRVYDLTNGGSKLHRLVNHTQCGCQCVVRPHDCNAVQEWHKDTCSCRCKYRDTPPSPCPRGQRWSNAKCACECDTAPKVCPVGKFWSLRACGCVCNGEKVSNCKRDENCECKPQVNANKGDKPKEIPKVSTLTLLLMVGEFVLMCLIFDAVLYHKNTGLTYSIAKKLRCKGQSKEVKSHETNMGKDNADISSVSAREEYDEKV